MIVDRHTHAFDNCPLCRGLAIWLNDNVLTPTENNILQAAEAVNWIDDHPELGIKVTKKERRRADMADAA